jgi:hypothetical protein
MRTQRKVEPEHVVGGSIALSVLTWFSVTALIEGEIRGHTKGGRDWIATATDDPSSYWIMVAFLLLTAFGWRLIDDVRI